MEYECNFRGTNRGRRLCPLINCVHGFTFFPLNRFSMDARPHDEVIADGAGGIAAGVAV
jgi:hypothetical protein